MPVSVVFLILAIEQRRCSASHLCSKLLCLTIHGKRVLPLLENLLQATDGLLKKTVFSATLITFRTLCDEGGAHALCI